MCINSLGRERKIMLPAESSGFARMARPREAHPSPSPPKSSIFGLKTAKYWDQNREKCDL
jgi:hypothetical protein